MAKSTQKKSMQQVRGKITVPKQDIIAVEEPLQIRLDFCFNGKSMNKDLAITMRTPGDDFALAAGFLFTEGLIHSADDLGQMTYCVDEKSEDQNFNVLSVELKESASFDPEKLLRHFYTTSSCGVCGKASIEALSTKGCSVNKNTTPVVSCDLIHSLPDKLRNEQETFSKTGGLHGVGLFNSKGDLVQLQEDIGRHNAVDKIIGSQVLDKKNLLSDHILLVSGRTSFEILQKALRAEIPIVAGVGAASSLAIETAEEFGITLLGFVRDEGFNVYCGKERIQ